MNLKIFYSALKRNGFNLFFAGFLLVIIFSPGAKSWLLKQLVSIGVFNKEIKNVKGAANLPECIPFSFINPEGKISNTDSLKGKIVFINFWASWCPPCRAEMPSINELYKKFKEDKQFVFLLISEDDNMATAKEYLQNNHFILPLYYRQGNVSEKIFDGTLPSTIVLNKEGKIVLKHDGIGGYNSDTFVQQLISLAK